ncbi:hypothetical protein D3C71_1649220 [compost metagenome]
MPVQFPQVVGDAAGADHQHAVSAQAGQGMTDAGLQGGSASGGQRDLDNRNIRLRIHQGQRHPDPMIERPTGIDARRKVGGVQQLDNLCGELRFAGRRVLHFEQRPWKTTKVMPGFGLGIAAD